MEEFKIGDWAVYDEPNRVNTFFKIGDVKSHTLFNYDGDGFDKRFCSRATESQLKEIEIMEGKPTDQIRPTHYGGKDNPYECIKVIRAWGLGFELGNVLKYVSRAGKKENQIEDLEKAKTYLEMEIEKLKAKKECEHYFAFDGSKILPCEFCGVEKAK